MVKKLHEVTFTWKETVILVVLTGQCHKIVHIFGLDQTLVGTLSRPSGGDDYSA